MPRPSRRRQVIDSAIALLDEEGLEGLTMRRLSERTGASPSSVYWYVTSREALVAVCLDEVIGEIALPDVSDSGWRAAADAMATDFRAMILRHPWVGVAAATFPDASGEQLARHNEHGLAVFEAAGFDPAGAELAMGALYTFALGDAIGTAGPRAWRADADEPDAATVAAGLERARSAAEAAGLSRLAARVAALQGADLDAVADRAFRFGLRCVLDGLERRL